MPGQTWLCAACGTQFPETAEPPAACPICGDARQPVPPAGQTWTTPDALRASHELRVRVFEHGVDGEPTLIGIGTSPSFAIGQRALLVRGPGGNVLWDCVPLLDETLEALVGTWGGIAAIAISHPHYYSNVVDWGRTFGARVLLHEADRQWVMRPDPIIEHWSGDQLPLGEGRVLHRLGGHFAGATVLHWADGAEGRGALLSGDVVQVLPDARSVSFMYGYPMLLPLPGAVVERMAARLRELRFDRLYGAWWGERVLRSGAAAAVQQSAERYLAALAGVDPIT